MIRAVLSFLFAVTLVIYAISYSATTVEVSPIVLIPFFLTILCAMYVIKQIKSTFPFVLKGSFIFLLSYCIVNFQVFLELNFGSIHFAQKILPPNNFIIIGTYSICLIGLICFLLGLTVKLKLPSRCYRSQSLQAISLYPLLIFNFGLLILFIVSVGETYLAGGYGGSLESKAVRYSLILELSYYAYLYFFVKSNDKTDGIWYSFKKIHPIYYVSLLLYFVILLAAGDRGPVLFLSLATSATVIYLSNIRLKNYYFIIVGVILIFGISIFGKGRRHGTGFTFKERIEMGLTDYNTSSDNPLSPATLELAGSGRLNFKAAQIVEEEGTFNGQFLLQQIIGVVPLLTSPVNSYFNINNREINSANFLTYKVLGPSPTYSVGTTCVADLYLDFGICGVILGLFLFGVIMRFVDDNIDNLKKIGTFGVCAILIFYSKSYYIPRSYISFEFRFIIWLWIFIMMYKLIFEKRNYGTRK